MSERESKPLLLEPEEQPVPAASSPRPVRSRLRRFFLRHLPLSLAGAFVLLVIAALASYFVASSARFENLVRERLITEIESLTGGRAEVAVFRWRLLHLEAEADGIVIHGTEDPGDVPYAQIGNLKAKVSILGVLNPHLRLRDLEIVQPRFHLIVYPDGSTNQPHPRNPKKSHQSLETLFQLRAGHVAIERGSLNFDDRAAVFDFQNRYAPLDFEASDVSLTTRYTLKAHDAPEFYRIEVGAKDLHLARQVPRKKNVAVEGTVAATVDFERDRLQLRNLTLAGRGTAIRNETLLVTGSLEDFTHPRWQAKIAGTLDMRLLEPITGYPDAPEGIAQVDLIAEGLAGVFDIDGGVHVMGGSYVGAGINARGVNLDARVHADRKQLLITQIAAHLRQGGQIEGSVDLEPWLPNASSFIARPPSAEATGSQGTRNVLVPATPWTILVNGKVAADFKDVTLDTILDIVCERPYRRLGIDALVNGPAKATWSNGDVKTISVDANLGLSPSVRIHQGESSATGAVDATYSQRTGAVDLRKLELHLPGSELEAHGMLGAYPVTSPSSINVDFRSRNLAEFDAVLRSLGFNRNGKSGIAALPLALTGEAGFQGSWTGSLVKPHLAGALKATGLTVEMPPGAGQSQPVHMDSIDVTGSYSPSEISIERAELARGNAKIALNGTLDATPEAEPEFDGNSTLHAHVEGSNVNVSDVQPYLVPAVGRRFPLAGEFDAQLQVDGPLRAPGGSGSLEMNNGSFNGEHFDHFRMQGVVADEELRITSAALNVAGGSVTASGNYDGKSKNFHLSAHGAGIALSRLDWVSQHKVDAVGELVLSLTGSGTIDDPHLEANAKVNDLALSGQTFGQFQLSAHTANRALICDASTQLQGAELNLHTSTTLEKEYQTNAQIRFSQFNVGALFEAAHIQTLSGQSALAGTISLNGPLAHPEQLRGEAQLRELAMTVAGVHLKSEGGLHATLAEGRIQLDPLRVTGEDTDLRAQGTMSIQGARQINVAAVGSINLRLAESVDPDLTASGITTFKVEAHGPLVHPVLAGSIEFQNGSMSLEDLPNGLSQLNGRLEFNQNRLEVKSLSAMSGGGLLNVTGFLSYQHGVYANLAVTGKEVHIRYPQGVTSLADAKLQLQGSQSNLLLSGDVLINRFATSPDLDLAALAAQAGAKVQTVAAPDSPSNHVRLDVHIVSSPQLSFQNAFAKLAGDVDLRVRGTLASPSLLGRVSVTEGSAMIAGTRYDLQRGDVTFTNPVRIDPVIDLSATAHVQDYDISLGLNGSLQKLSITYRSDPPLPEADVVSLLALGHTANQQRLYTQQQEQAISNPTTDALLGGALNATVSNRVQKLFGAGSVKVDPNYLGAFGNSTSRITVQEQLGRDVILTYATDVNTTSQQLLQAEVAINRHVSLVVARDESGVFSMVVKATRRYR
jgi:translocation and assembly module TamB